MARLRRSDLPDGVFHVTSHGIGAAPIFRDDVDRLDFLNLLAIVADRFGWTIHAYCLMDTHYHVVVATTTAQLSAGMQALNGRYAQLFNHRHRRRGHLFEGRFRSWLVRDERHLEATCTYVLQNPVKAHQCATAAEWPWSEVAIVREQYGEPLVGAEPGNRRHHVRRRKSDVPAEEEPARARLLADNERNVARGVTGCRHDQQPAVTRNVERTRERSHRRPVDLDQDGLSKRPMLGNVTAQPP